MKFISSLSSIALAFQLASYSLTGVNGLDNGLARTPPMGWRSWNLYGANVDQTLIQSIMDGIVKRTRLVDGVPTSLKDLGYSDVGLDDNWQQCSSYGTDKYTYHDETGIPQINTQRFPDMKKMTDYAHERNLTAGWYLNNCICRDHCGSNNDFSESDPKCYKGDVSSLVEFGFDGVKLDGCSYQRDLQLWADTINATGRPVVIENCHWGGTVPTESYCPWHFFRSSQDITASYPSVISNLQTTSKWATTGLSKPGCWAYPDMLEVGVNGLTEIEWRTHFGAWCIVSSPLILSYDVNNDTVSDSVWDIVSNKEAIAVNQAWAGHSGSVFAHSSSTVYLIQGLDIIHSVLVAEWQAYYKPLQTDGKKTAVFLVNHASSSLNVTFEFKSIPSFVCQVASVRDVWNRKDVGSFSLTYQATLNSHDSAFFTLNC